MPIIIENVEFYTVTEIAKMAKVSRTYILKLIEEKRILAKETLLGNLISYDQYTSWLSTRRKPGRPRTK